MKRERIQLIDDLTGGDAAETLRFSLDGTFYEIDLCEKNATKMRRAFAAYITASRRVRNPYKTALRYSTPRNARKGVSVDAGHRRSEAG